VPILTEASFRTARGSVRRNPRTDPFPAHNLRLNRFHAFGIQCSGKLISIARGIRVLARGASNMAKAIWGGKVIAESNNTVVVEGNQYFPPDSVAKNVLKSSTHTSICPWKGTAHYYHVEVDGMKNENAAWYYPEPNPAAAEIKGRIAFWKGVRVETGKN
jgi:uncharacterized protein (DUF427 family)